MRGTLRVCFAMMILTIVHLVPSISMYMSSTVLLAIVWTWLGAGSTYYAMFMYSSCTKQYSLVWQERVELCWMNDEWCVLSYFVYVFLHDINLLLYIYIPVFPSFRRIWCTWTLFVYVLCFIFMFINVPYMCFHS